MVVFVLDQLARFLDDPAGQEKDGHAFDDAPCSASGEFFFRVIFPVMKVTVVHHQRKNWRRWIGAIF